MAKIWPIFIILTNLFTLEGKLTVLTCNSLLTLIESTAPRNLEKPVYNINWPTYSAMHPNLKQVNNAHEGSETNTMHIAN